MKFKFLFLILSLSVSVLAMEFPGGKKQESRNSSPPRQLTTAGQPAPNRRAYKCEEQEDERESSLISENSEFALEHRQQAVEAARSGNQALFDVSHALAEGYQFITDQCSQKDIRKTPDTVRQILTLLEEYQTRVATASPLQTGPPACLKELTKTFKKIYELERSRAGTNDQWKPDEIAPSILPIMRGGDDDDFASRFQRWEGHEAHRQLLALSFRFNNCFNSCRVKRFEAELTGKPLETIQELQRNEKTLESIVDHFLNAESDLEKIAEAEEDNPSLVEPLSTHFFLTIKAALNNAFENEAVASLVGIDSWGKELREQGALIGSTPYEKVIAFLNDFIKAATASQRDNRLIFLYEKCWLCVLQFTFAQEMLESFKRATKTTEATSSFNSLRSYQLSKIDGRQFLNNEIISDFQKSIKAYEKAIFYAREAISAYQTKKNSELANSLMQIAKRYGSVQAGIGQSYFTKACLMIRQEDLITIYASKEDKDFLEVIKGMSEEEFTSNAEKHLRINNLWLEQAENNLEVAKNKFVRLVVQEENPGLAGEALEQAVKEFKFNEDDLYCTWKDCGPLETPAIKKFQLTYEGIVEVKDSGEEGIENEAL